MIPEWWTAFDSVMAVLVGTFVLGLLGYSLMAGLTFTAEANEWHKAQARLALRRFRGVRVNPMCDCWPDISEADARSMTRQEAAAKLREWMGTPEAGRPATRHALGGARWPSTVTR